MDTEQAQLPPVVGESQIAFMVAGGIVREFVAFQSVHVEQVHAVAGLAIFDVGVGNPFSIR